MTANEAAETNLFLHQFAAGVGRLVGQMQKPDPEDGSWRRTVAETCDSLIRMVDSAGGKMDQCYDHVGPVLDRLLKSIDDCSTELAGSASVRRVREISGSIADQYEDLRRCIRRYRWSHASELRHCPKPARLLPLKPVNYRRNLFHVSVGVGIVLVYQFLMTPFAATLCSGTFFGICLVLEIVRRISPRFNAIVCAPFKHVIRPWEYGRPNSSSWLAFAVFLSVLIMPKAAAEMGVLIIALADPAATIAGKKWGVRKLYQSKSIVGSLTFFLVAVAASAAVYAMSGLSLEPWKVVGMLTTVALAGAATELGCQRLDDNFAVPTICSGIAALWMA